MDGWNLALFQEAALAFAEFEHIFLHFEKTFLKSFICEEKIFFCTIFKKSVGSLFLLGNWNFVLFAFNVAYNFSSLFFLVSESWLNLTAKWNTSWCTVILLCRRYTHKYTQKKQVFWHRFRVHLWLYVVVRAGVGRRGHLSTAAAMRARASEGIGGLGWRLPWFPSPISAADLPSAMPGLGNTETVQPRSPGSRLVVRLN